MHKPILMSAPLIVMLTACGGSDSETKTEVGKQAPKNTITFSGTVYDGPMADTTVSVYAGHNLLASGKTDVNGKYSVNASISVAEFDNIKSQPITYHAQRNDIILYQFSGTSLAEAFKNKSNQALITNFSTVEYVVADEDKNNFVTAAEWNSYQQLDSNFTELVVVRYGVGLKSVIDHSAKLTGFKNSTAWLRAVLSDPAWQDWYKGNTKPYKLAWDTLFSDTWFVEQESHRFEDINAWKTKHNYVVTEGPLDPDAAFVERLTMSGISQKVSVGDLLSPSIKAFWSDDTSSDVSGLATYSISPEKALTRVNGGQLQVNSTGTITLKAKYKGSFDEVTFDSEAAVLASLRFDSIHRQQLLHDEWKVTAQGVHQNDYLVDFSNEAEWTSSNPETIEPLGNGRFLSKGVGTATVTATLGDLTAKQQFDVIAKIISVSLNLPNGIISREETIQLSLNGEFNDGSVSVITDEVIWTSSNPEFLTIDENGIATGISEGQSVVTATYQGFTLEETVTVTYPKIVSSTPSFVDGVLTLTEGDILEYKLKFVRSNGIEHVFTAENGLNFESSEFRGLWDPSGIQIAEIDKDSDRIHGIRAGKIELHLDDAPTELQQIFVELGAISSAKSRKSDVILEVNVLDNADVYQWHYLDGNPPAGQTVTVVQAIQSGNTLYRFWQVEGAEQDGVYLTKVTSEGESAPALVLAASKDEYNSPRELKSNGIIHDNYGYIFLLIDSENPAAIDTQLAYRYKLSDGSMTEIPLANYPSSRVNLNGDSFAFTPNGDFVVTDTNFDDGITPYIYHFETGAWEEKAPMPGERIQTPSNKTQVAILDTKKMNVGSFKPPVLSTFDLETQQITTQELVMPGDAEYYCRSVETMSFAIADDIKDSGAGCMVAKVGESDGIGYWLWDSIAELPKLHLFSEGYVRSTSGLYAVAYHKPDGHVAFSVAGVTIDDSVYVYDVAEIVDVEVDGVIEQQVTHKRLTQRGKALESFYNIHVRLQDGSQYTVNNADVPNESITVFNKGTAVRDEHGQWSSDKYMYALPAYTDNSNKLYNLGDTIVISQEGSSTKTQYWQLQMREPKVVEQPEEPVIPEEPTTPEEPVVPEEPTTPEEPVVPEEPVEPTPAQ